MKERVDNERAPGSGLLHELFERQARLTPDALAVADEESHLTYRELDQRASLLASRLRESGTGPNSAVGIYMERCAEYVISMLAALKAGGAFLPLELAYPRSMLEEIHTESNPTLVLTKERLKGDLPPRCETFALDPGWEERFEKRKSPENPALSTEDLAFIAYSSGTTGKPKGIANSHRAAVESYLWRAEISAPGRLVGCNVFFVWEVLRPLLYGGASCVIPDDEIYDPLALVERLAGSRVTETLVTPSLLESILNNVGDDLSKRLPNLQTLWLNGEVVTKPLARRAMEALPKTRLLNVYSISEAHEVAAGDLRELCKDPNSTHCPVGEPMNPTETYILDEDLRRVSGSEDGELYVGGECLARGYVNLPQKTAERFIQSPFSAGRRLYRTGDRARLLPNGRLEILGRCDFMVKVRGYSIELGAVETAIEEALPVKSCAVVADGKEGEDKRLVAYLVPNADWRGPDIDPKTGRSPRIRNALKTALPHYAIPAAFVVADSLPLQGTTRKTDRAELPPPPERIPRETPPAGELKLPSNASVEERETAIKRVWESVLRLDRGDVEREDDFFDTGGHSLAAAETLTALEEVFGVRLPVSALLEAPTVASLQRRISTTSENGDSESAEFSRRSPEHSPRLDARLETGISPSFNDSFDDSSATLPKARKIFLTGATGFLGAFLLDGLLRETGAEVYCLARRRNGSSPLSTICDNLAAYGLWRAEDAERILPLAGDLSEPLLGLGEETFGEISRGVDLVFHAGATVNLVYPYSALKPANVDGTREVLRLCCEDRTKPLHYVSTNGVFPPGTGRCFEGASLDTFLEDLAGGYEESKWVSEGLVREAGRRGLPFRIYRPGNISGHSESGASNPKDFLTAVISESVRIGSCPQVEGWRMETTPVDFVAGAILRLSTLPNPSGETFHLANPAPPLASEVFDEIESLGFSLDRLELRDWMRERYEGSGQNHAGEDIVGGVLGASNPDPRHLRQENSYDDSNTRRALENTLQRPPLDAKLLSNYLRHFEERNWIPTLQHLSNSR